MRIAILDRSLAPRSWTYLLDRCSAADLGPRAVAVDVGCGRGNYSFELARRFACRDMLVHVPDLRTALRECHRILRPGGKMLVWVTVETELMEPRESERLYVPLAVEPKSLSRENLEVCFQIARFDVDTQEDLGSELIEFYEGKDARASRELMRIALMRRIIILGKLSSGFYLLQKN